MQSKIVGGESPRSLGAAAKGSRGERDEEGVAEGSRGEDVLWKEPQPL